MKMEMDIFGNIFLFSSKSELWCLQNVYIRRSYFSI